MIFFIFQVVVFVYSVVIHEVSHGLMAFSMGDRTAKDLGRLTLNPFKHLDMFGSFLLPLFLYFGQIYLPPDQRFVFGYAKPVPYEPSNLDDRRYGPAKVAFAGPAANIMLGVMFGLVLRFLPDTLISPLMQQLLSFIVAVNFVLALFNLFPIPPLDGHWLLMAILPSQFTGLRVVLYRYSLVLLIFFIFFIFPYLFPLIVLAARLVAGPAFIL